MPALVIFGLLHPAGRIGDIRIIDPDTGTEKLQIRRLNRLTPLLGVLNLVVLPNCSATVVEKGYTVDEPTMEM